MQHTEHKTPMHIAKKKKNTLQFSNPSQTQKPLSHANPKR